MKSITKIQSGYLGLLAILALACIIAAAISSSLLAIADTSICFPYRMFASGFFSLAIAGIASCIEAVKAKDITRA